MECVGKLPVAVPAAGRRERPASRITSGIVALHACLALALLLSGGSTHAAPRPVPVPAPDTSPLPTGRVGSDAHILTKTDVDAWLDGFMPYALHRGDIGGAVVVVVEDGRTLTERGFGYSDVAARTPVDPAATIFRPGSISKLFTWTAVMQLAEQGKLNLDADVNRYLDFRIPAFHGEPVTMRELMQHTAGFDDTLHLLIQSGEKRPEPLGRLLQDTLPKRIFAPGRITAYSNYGAALAGYIVQRVSGMSYDAYVERRIFAPLGMTRSSFRQPLPASLRPFVSKGYVVASAGAEPYETIRYAPAGSLAATGDDIGKFMIAHLAHGGPLIRPATARAMYDGTNDVLPHADRMALGFFAENRNGHRILAHAGDTRLFHSYLWLFIDDGVGVFVSLNAPGRDGAAGAIRTALLSGFADRYFPRISAERAVVPDAARDARLIAGQYLSSYRSETNFLSIENLFNQTRVVAGANGIRLFPDRGLGGGSRTWTEISPLLWRASDTGELLEARIVDGRVERFATLPYADYLPVPWWMSARWLLPAGQWALLTIVLTAISWPAGAAARKYYGIGLPGSGIARWNYRLVRGAALLVALIAGGWYYIFSSGGPDWSLYNGGYDDAIEALEIITPLSTIGVSLMAARSAYVAWRSPRRLMAVPWAIVLMLSSLVINYIAFSFHLAGINLRY